MWRDVDKDYKNSSLEPPKDVFYVILPLRLVNANFLKSDCLGHSDDLFYVSGQATLILNCNFPLCVWGIVMFK